MAWIIVLSVFGFGAFMALDLPVLRNQRLLRTPLSITACVSLVSALWLTPAGAELLPSMPDALRVNIGVSLITVAILLLAYSIFIEIPLLLSREARTRGSAQEPDAQNKLRLVVKGTYALCRHPGYLWLSILLIGYILIENNINAIFTTFLWSGLNLLLVIVQDRFIFPATFSDYTSYQRSTPFLIPTSASIAASLERTEAKHADI